MNCSLRSPTRSWVITVLWVLHRLTLAAVCWKVNPWKYWQLSTSLRLWIIFLAVDWRTSNCLEIPRLMGSNYCLFTIIIDVFLVLTYVAPEQQTTKTYINLHRALTDDQHLAATYYCNYCKSSKSVPSFFTHCFFILAFFFSFKEIMPRYNCSCVVGIT